MRFGLGWWCALAVASSSTTNLWAKDRLAVMPLAAKRIPQQTADLLSDLLISQVDAAGTYDVLGANDINAMLGLERMKDALLLGFVFDYQVAVDYPSIDAFF